MFDIENKNKEEIISYLSENLSQYKKNLNLKATEFQEFQEKYIPFVGGIMLNYFLDDKPETINAIFLEIMKVAISISFRIQDEGDIITYLNYFSSGIYKKKIMAMMQFRLLDNPEKQLPLKFDKVAGLLQDVIVQDDSQLTNAIDILKEYFDKVFSQDYYQNNTNRASFISTIKENQNYIFFLNYEEFTQYIDEKIIPSETLEKIEKIEAQIEEIEDIEIEAATEGEIDREVKLKGEREEEIKSDLLKELEEVERKHVEELKKKDDEIIRLAENRIETPTSINIGIIGPEQSEKKLKNISKEFWEQWYNVEVTHRYYGAWGKDESQVSIFTIIENDIVIVGPNDHVWKDIPKDRAGSKDAICSFIKNEKDKNGKPICKYMYKAVPEGSRKNPKLTKSLVQNLVTEGVEAYLRERKNDDVIFSS